MRQLRRRRRRRRATREMTAKLFFFFFFFLLLVSGSFATKQGDTLFKFSYDPAHPHRKTVGTDPLITSLSVSVDSAQLTATNSDGGSKEQDKIVSLPGQPEGVDFNQYGGYITVDKKAGRALFYYFSEAAGSAGNPSSKPLVLWLNGGPGCSSLGYGAMEELGPFRVASDGRTLYRNPYAWNEVANVLFLESPAGVGFSYSNTTSDYNQSGDNRTAADAYTFLVNWMERFSEYKGRDFYIAGESYAGHYVPQLADVILQNNIKSSSSNNSILKLKGIMIGNAAINDEMDTKGMYDYFWTHALISDSTIETIHKSCNFTPTAAKQTDDCVVALEDANQVFNLIDIYNIYAPLCFSSSVTPTPIPTSIENFDPCTDLYVKSYLNDPKVQEALHANLTKLNYPWTSCSNVIQTWLDSPSTTLPIIGNLLSNDIRVWVYSGDIDGRIPMTSSRYSLDRLNFSIVRPWQAWMTKDEVGGFSMIYEKNLTFVTIRGAGHEVPSYQPLRALELIKYFLQGTSIP